VNLIEDEIEENKVDISNEEIWLNGSNTEESIEIHKDNIRLRNEYNKFLQEFLNKIKVA
jgi:hypothetical protein